jgi:hypothetical protein
MHRLVSFVAVVFLLLGFASFVEDSQFPASVLPIAFPDLGENLEPVAHAPQPSSASHTPQSSLTTPKAFGPQVVANYGKLPLGFEINEGQTGADVKFVSRGRGYSVFLTGTEAVIALKKSTPQAPDILDKRRSPHRRSGPEKTRDPGESKVVHMQLAGANSSRRVVGMDELPGKVNYIIGNDPAKWRANIPTYAKVKYENVYPGVDLVYYGNQGQLEYDFVVAPGVDPHVIQLSFTAPEKLRLDEQGDLLLDAANDEVRFQKPVVYQQIGEKKKSIEGAYLLASANQIAFQVGNYDHSRPLVIDPALAYSTYLGGDRDTGNGVAVDGAGSAYVIGSTQSSNFPTANALQGMLLGNTNVFVSKLNPSGSALVYSTYLGGSGNDFGNGIAVDSAGNAYVTGTTGSYNFPTANALQSTNRGSTHNAFVSKLNPSGTALVYSTYLGGSQGDQGIGIAVDGSGNAYVTGSTLSTDFPTANALQSTSPGGQKAFVSKFNTSGAALVYSTYLGGSQGDQGGGIAVDGLGNAYVTGSTSSTDFPTVNAFQGSLRVVRSGYSNAFVSKLNPSGSALVYSTYLGGGGPDNGNGIAVDGMGNAYVTGTTFSINFPTFNALQSTLSLTVSAFVSKFNPSGSALVYSTYLNGNAGLGGSWGYSIAVDGSGNAYVTGSTSSTNFPTANALQGSLVGPGDNAFVSELNPSGSALGYSTYLGGGGDSGNGIAVDGSGNAYVTGFTQAAFFPTVNPVQPSLLGFQNAFVAKIAVTNVSTTTNLISSFNPGYLGQSLTFTATVRPPGLGNPPSGTVAFLDGSTPLGQVALDSTGQAQFSTSALTLGTHSIVAQYGGDTEFLPSTAVVTQVIDGPPFPTSTGLVSSPSLSNYGQSVTLTATVTSPVPGTPTGVVIFLETNGNANQNFIVGQATLGTNGQAQLTTAALRPAPFVSGVPGPSFTSVQAYYVGDANFVPSGTTIAQTVNPPQTPVSITVTPASQTLILGGNSQQYATTGHYPDGSSLDFTPFVSWTSSSPAVATINSSGVASAVGPGNTAITASYFGVFISPPAALGVEIPGTSVLFLGGGSSAMFLELGQAAQSSAVTATPCVWTQSSASNLNEGVIVRDQRPGGNTSWGDIWITWSPGAGTCAAPGGNIDIYAYTSLDSVFGVQCYFEVDSSGLPGCVQHLPVPAGTPGQNLLCNVSSPCAYGPDTPIPLAVITALHLQHWFAAGTDILPVDAKFAVYRMLQPCGQAVYRQPFGQGLSQTFGLGYQDAAFPGTGFPVYSYFSNSSFNPVDFNISGRDPLNTAMTVPAYSVSTLGAKPIIVAVSPAGDTAIGAATDITGFNLALFTTGVLGRTTDLVGPTTTLPVTTLISEPLSGAYNVMEYSVANSSQFHTSQDATNCDGSGGVGSNPMHLQSTNGQVPAFRARAIGTSEMIAQLQAAPSAGDQRLGYFFWSAANAAGFTAANGKYLTVNGVDPLQDTYTGGVLPGSDSSHPLSNVTFKSLNMGDYPIWSVMRIVSQSPAPVGVASLILATQALNSSQHNFISANNLQVWHSHYYLPTIANGVAALGNTIATPNDLCNSAGVLPELGGDVGGATLLKQVNSDFCADFSNVTGLINASN